VHEYVNEFRLHCCTRMIGRTNWMLYLLLHVHQYVNVLGFWLMFCEYDTASELGMKTVLVCTWKCEESGICEFCCVSYDCEWIAGWVNWVCWFMMHMHEHRKGCELISWFDFLHAYDSVNEFGTRITAWVTLWVNWMSWLMLYELGVTVVSCMRAWMAWGYDCCYMRTGLWLLLNA